MGNKRKPLFVIMGVIILAFVAAAGGFLALLPGRIISNAAMAPGVGQMQWREGSRLNGGDAVDFTLIKDEIYYIEFAGQDGESWDNRRGGYGATCFIVVKSDGSQAKGIIGLGGGAGRSGTKDGGGYTKIVIGTEEYYAGGGGGAGEVRGRDAGWASGEGQGDGAEGWHTTANSGQPGTQSGPGAGGKGDGNGSGDEDGGDADGHNGGTHADNTGGGGGGGGYFGGGQGSYAVSHPVVGWPTSYRGAGGGGSCSPNCYPIHAADYKGEVSTSFGYIGAARISPDFSDTYKNGSYGEKDAFITATLPTLNGKESGKAGVLVKLQYKYKDRNDDAWTQWIDWDSSNYPKREKTNSGTTDVQWQLLVSITGKGNLTSAVENSVMAEGKFELSVSKAKSFISEDSVALGLGLMGNGAARYLEYDGQTKQIFTRVGDASWPTEVKESFRWTLNEGTGNSQVQGARGVGTNYWYRFSGDTDYELKFWTEESTNYVGSSIFTIKFSVRPVMLTSPEIAIQPDKKVINNKTVNLRFNGVEQRLFAGSVTYAPPLETDGYALYCVVAKSSGNRAFLNDDLSPKNDIPSTESNRWYGKRKLDDVGFYFRDVDTYYVYCCFQSNNTKNVAHSDWILVGENQIDKADFDEFNNYSFAGMRLNNGLIFNGFERALYELDDNFRLQADVILYPSDYGRLSVKYSYRPFGGTAGDVQAGIRVIDAGVYEIYVDIDDSGHNINGGRYKYGEVEIAKAGQDWATSNIKLSGLTASPKTPYSGTPQYVFARNTSGDFNITIGVVQESLRTSWATNDYAYAITQESDINNLDASMFTDLNYSPTQIPQSIITNNTVTAVGDHYLWIKFKNHLNIADNVMLCYPQYFTIGKLSYQELDFGARSQDNPNGLAYRPTRTFDAKARSIVEGEMSLPSWFDANAVNLQFKVGTQQYPYIADPNGNDWVSNISSAVAETVGTYYLWARWDDCEGIEGTNQTALGARLVFSGTGHTITQMTNPSMITFSGLEFNTGRVFSNTESSLVTGGSLQMKIGDGDLIDDLAIIQSHLGTIKYGVARYLSQENKMEYLSTTITKNNVDETALFHELTAVTLDQLKVKGAGNYYLIITWSGTANIAACNQLQGRRYALKPVGEEDIPNLIISPANVVIGGIQAKTVSTAAGTVNGQYYCGEPIALFEFVNSLTAPQFFVTAADSDILIPYTTTARVRYALTKSKEETPSSDDWQNLLTAATQLDVYWSNFSQSTDSPFNVSGNILDYYLWIEITGDPNLVDSLNYDYNEIELVAPGQYKLVRYQSNECKKYNLAAPILPIPAAMNQSDGPRARVNIVDDGSPQKLILPSRVADPVVIYAVSLHHDETFDNLTWYRTADSILTGILNENNDPVYGGDFYVYYCAMMDKNHTKPDVIYCLTVNVVSQKSNIKVMPVALDVYYTGEEQPLFKAGLGTIKVGGVPTDVALKYYLSDEKIDNTNSITNWQTLPAAIGAGANVDITAFKRKDVGDYYLYFCADTASTDNPITQITLSISKARIKDVQPIFTAASVYYDQKPHQALFSRASFGFLQGESGDTPLTIAENKIGALGVIEYGYSLVSGVFPNAAYESHNGTAMQFTTAGTYFIYYRIWAGENHLGTGNFAYTKAEIPTGSNLAPKWESAGAFRVNKINMNQQNGVYTGNLDLVEFSGYTPITTDPIYYNGLHQVLMQKGSEVVKVNGEIENVGNAKRWYSLTSSKYTAPTVWYDNIELATESEHVAGEGDVGYYLWVKLAETTNITEIYLCVSDSPVNILKAGKNQLTFTGLDMVNRLYDGKPQILAVGRLAVLTTAGIDVLSNTDGQGVSYKFTASNTIAGEGGWEPSIAAASVQTVEATESGYYLWIKLADTNNISCEPICYNYSTAVKITKSGIDYYFIVNPEFDQTLLYQGQGQRKPLILVEAQLKSRATEAIIDVPATYYVSRGAAVDFATLTDDDWVAADEIFGIDAGVYYIWVRFGEGINNGPIGPVSCGSVEIAPQNGRDILVGGIAFKTGLMFNAGLQDLIEEPNAISIGFIHELNAVSALGNGVLIQYGVSNGENIIPDLADWVDHADLFDNGKLNAKLQRIYADKYYFWVKVSNAGSNYTDFVIQITDNDLEYIEIVSYSTTVAPVRNGDALIIGDLVITGISPLQPTFTGALQTIWGGTVQAELNSKIVTLGEVYFCFGESATSCLYRTDFENDAWKRNLNNLQKTDVKPYYLWIRFSGNNNFAAIAPTYYCTGSIQQADAVITPGSIVFYPDWDTMGIAENEVTIDNMLTYNGRELPLIKTPGQANFGEIEYRLLVRSGDSNNYVTEIDWTTNYQEIAWCEPVSYVVECRVRESINWKQSATIYSDYNGGLRRYIAKALPTILVNPVANYEMYYRYDKSQVLFSAGVLELAALTEGCEIVYRLTGTSEFMSYTEENIAEYFSAKSAGTYNFEYSVIVPAGSAHYRSGLPLGTITATIKRVEIFWLREPEAINLGYTGKPQPFMTVGRFNTADPAVKIVYRNGNTESYTLPTATERGYYNGEYKLSFDPQNYYIYGANGERLDADSWHSLTAYVGKTALNVPYSVNMRKRNVYAAQSIDLVNHITLAAGDFAEEVEPWMQYGWYHEMTGKVTWLEYGILPQATDPGDYDLIYRVRFGRNVSVDSDDLTAAEVELAGKYFDLYDPNPEKTFIARILSLTIENGDLVAIYKNGERDFDLNLEKYSPAIKNKLKSLEANGGLYYEFRLNDPRFPCANNEVGWTRWTSTNAPGAVGHYELRVRIDGLEQNFFSDYKQLTDTFEIMENTQNLMLKVYFEGTLPPELRPWLDMTGNQEYAQTSLIDRLVPQELVESANSIYNYTIFDFGAVNSLGQNNNGELKVQTMPLQYPNGFSGYYYISSNKIDAANRDNYPLTNENTGNQAVSIGRLINLCRNDTNIIELWVYEVYKVEFRANGGVGVVPETKWKWHNESLTLPKNNLGNSTNRLENGWNMAESGGATNYRSGEEFVGNYSAVLWAQFYKKGEEKYIIEWYVGNWRLSANKVWYNVIEEPKTTSGVTVAKNSKIYLPETQSLYDKQNWGAQYILGWYFNCEKVNGEYQWETGVEYQVGWPVERNYIFVARLSEPGARVVNVSFRDAQNNYDLEDTIKDVGYVVQGAPMYLALSGVTENDFQKYNYQKWYSEHEEEVVLPDSAVQAVAQYAVDAFPIVTPPSNGNSKKSHEATPTEIVIMVIMIVFGLVLATGCLVIYLPLRKKRIAIKLKDFEEEEERQLPTF